MPKTSKSQAASSGQTASSKPGAPTEPVPASSSTKKATKPVAAKSSAASTGAPTRTAKAASGAKTGAPTAKATSPAGRAVPKKAPKAARSPFLDAQRDALMAERGNYLHQANELKAQADSLALEHEPGDVQFDEEGGEGGTSNVDRELDLVLSGQARATIDEIDRALVKIDLGTYGTCERCGQEIPEARLEALPHAALCVVCKSGGLSSRR